MNNWTCTPKQLKHSSMISNQTTETVRTLKSEHSAPSLPVSARALERACCLRKTCQWPTSRLTTGGSPMPPTRRCPSKGIRMSLPPCNECPPRALGPISTRWGALKPLNEHVASEKRANSQRRGSPWEAYPCLLPNVAHQKAHGCPSPHAMSALPVHSARLGSLKSPQALERACCLGKTCQWLAHRGIISCCGIIVQMIYFPFCLPCYPYIDQRWCHFNDRFVLQHDSSGKFSFYFQLHCLFIFIFYIMIRVALVFIVTVAVELSF